MSERFNGLGNAARLLTSVLLLSGAACSTQPEQEACDATKGEPNMWLVGQHGDFTYRHDNYTVTHRVTVLGAGPGDTPDGEPDLAQISGLVDENGQPRNIVTEGDEIMFRDEDGTLRLAGCFEDINPNTGEIKVIIYWQQIITPPTQPSQNNA